MTLQLKLEIAYREAHKIAENNTEKRLIANTAHSIPLLGHVQLHQPPVADFLVHNGGELR